MVREYAVLSGIVVSMILLLIATLYYPGGSNYDKNATGFDWGNNYLSNLFSENAVNGSGNLSKNWAIFGMFFLTGSFGLFFTNTSKKMPTKRAARVVKYTGIASVVFAFLAVTPYHDTMVTMAVTGALISMFYITVFVLKSKLHFLKILSVSCLLMYYGFNYMYFTRSYLTFLPIVQKISLLVTIVWVLWLEYFTERGNF